MFEHIPLGRGRFALIDLEDWWNLADRRWRALKSAHNYYAVCRAPKGSQKTILFMHRVIMHCPAHLYVHHINGNTLDNRKSNLKILTISEHQQLTLLRKILKFDHSPNR